MEPGLTSQIKEAQTTLETIQEMSRLLNTGLSPEALTVCVRLCEVGVNPEVLSSLVRDFQREVQEYRRQVPRNNRNVGNQN